MQKSDLRKLYTAKRNQLSDEELNNNNHLLLNQFKRLDLASINSIHIFLPIISKKEPNTYLIIDWLQEKFPKIDIVVSKSNFSNSSMSNHPYLGKSDIITGAYQIPEPQTHLTYDKDINMVLVPLLAFDRKGYRVGYGKGFYDKFLSKINPIKIGISYFDAVDEISDIHSEDIKLDYCLTPNQIYSFVI